MKLIGTFALCLLLAGCASDNSSGPAAGKQPPGSSPAGEPLPIGDAEERLAVAARLRRDLRDGQATVIVNGTKLLVTYKSGTAEEAADNFIRQQGEAGMARIANAGFETLVVSAQDANGPPRTKEIPVASYRTK